MKGLDRYLIGIVVGIVLLVVASFIVVLLRPQPEYRSTDSPESTVHNYLLALRNDDYERAYAYLSTNLISYPADLQTFVEDVENQSWLFRTNQDVSLNVQSARIIGDVATVEVLETRFSNNRLFDSGHYESHFDMKVRLEGDTWKLFDGDSYWNTCWDKEATDDLWCR